MKGTTAYVLANENANKLASGFSSIKENSTHDGILFTTNAGTSFDVKIPNFHSHSNLSLLEKFSLDANGKLLFDGNEIPASGVLSEDEVKEIWNEVENNN